MHNKKIGIGFVGAGWMGSTLIQRIIESDDTELLALHQRSQKRAEETLKNLGCLLYTSPSPRDRG